MAKKSSIYPMIIPLGNQSVPLYRVGFPQDLKEKMLRLESEANSSFKRYLGHRLPFDTLKKMLSRYMGVIFMSPVSESSDDKSWVISLSPVDGSLLGRVFQIWIESFYILEQELSSSRSKVGNWKQLAQEVMESVGPDTFDCPNEAEEVALIEDGIPVKDSCCFEAIPMMVVNELKGRELLLDNIRLPLWANGTNELITRPDMLSDDEGVCSSSLVLHFSVQTIPSVKNAFLNVEISKRRWLSSAAVNKVWLETDKSAYIPIGENQFLQIWGRKCLEWYSKDIRWYETLFPGKTLPDMKCVLECPEDYVLGTNQPIYVPFDNRIKWSEHSQATGVQPMIRKKVLQQLKELLRMPTDEVSAERVCGGNKSDLTRYFGEKSFALVENSGFPEALRCALRGRKLSVEVWAPFADSESMGAARAVYETFENHMQGSDVAVEIRNLDQWCVPLEAAREKKNRNDSFFRRVQNVEDQLSPSDHPIVSVIVLRERKVFEDEAFKVKKQEGLTYRPDVDPKEALRIGFAKTGRLTQFMTPEQFRRVQKALERKHPAEQETSVEANQVVKHTVLDVYRQLGIMNDLHTSKRLQNETFVGITMMNFTKTIYGKQVQPFPVVTVLDGKNKCVSVYCDLLSDELMPYDEFLLTFARYFSQPAVRSGSDAYSSHKLHSFLSRFFDKNRAVILLESNALTRRCIRNVSNTSIDLSKQSGDFFTLELVDRKEVLPLTIPASRLRGLIRIRTSVNHEVPDYYNEESEKGFSANAGVFDFMGTYYSLDSRASQEYGAMQMDESLTDVKKFLTHRRLVEIYPIFADSGDVQACLEDVHSLRFSAIQFDLLRTQLPLPLNFVERDKLMEYCVLPR